MEEFIEIFVIRSLQCEFCDANVPHEIHKSHLQCLSCLRLVTVQNIIETKLRLARKNKTEPALPLENRNDSLKPRMKPFKPSRRQRYSKYHPKRNTKISRHHLIPRWRKGPDEDWNKVFIWRDKHDEWHEVFGNTSFDEIIQLVFSHWDLFLNNPEKHNRLLKIFHRTDRIWVLRTLLRLRRFKNRF